MTSCTDNGPCGKGSCCDINSASALYRKCTTAPVNCYVGDGSRDEGFWCAANSYCATRCCNRFTDECDATSTTSVCMSDGLPGWAIAIIVVFSLGFIAILIVCICCCVRANKRKRRNSAQKSTLTVVSAHHTAQPTHQHDPSNRPLNGYQINQAAAYPQAVQIQGNPANTQVYYIPQP